MPPKTQKPERQRPEKQEHEQRGVTVTIPRPVVDVATAPFAIVGRVLPAKRGLPLYAGLGVLAVAEVVSWPVATGLGVAYASIRRWGPTPQQAGERPEADDEQPTGKK